MIGLFTRIGKPLCTMKTASGMLAITSNDQNFMGFLDRSNITVSETPAKFAKACPVLWRIAVPEIGTGVVKVCKVSRASKPIDEFLKGMEKSRNVKVKVLEEQPDEMVENQPRECHASFEIQKLVEYINGIRGVAENVNEIKNLSNSMTRLKMPEGMWGIKDVKKVLSGVVGDIKGLKESFDMFEVAVESTDKKASMIHSMLGHGMKKNDILAKMASDLVKDFFVFKTLVSGLSQALYPLSSIDITFKRATGYPTTWAFDPATFYDFQFCYDGLIKNLVRLAKSEISIIEPLFVWKVHSQSTGEK